MVSSAKRVRRTMGHSCIARDTPEALADDSLWIGGPSRERDEAAVHVEGRARAWAAIGGGWFDDDLRVVEMVGLVAEELGYALRDELIAEPFGLAKAFPTVAPVGIEALRAADALEARDVADDRREPRDKCMDRPGPCGSLARCICVVGFRGGHGRDYTAPNIPADLAPVFPPNLWRKCLIGLEFVVQFPPNANNGFPSNPAPSCDLAKAESPASFSALCRE
jgi:hypothetical protein